MFILCDVNLFKLALTLALWLVADFEALSYQVTITFDTGWDVR